MENKISSATLCSEQADVCTVWFLLQQEKDMLLSMGLILLLGALELLVAATMPPVMPPTENQILLWCMMGSLGAAVGAMLFWPPATMRSFYGTLVGTGIFGWTFGPFFLGQMVEHGGFELNMRNAMASGGVTALLGYLVVRPMAPRIADKFNRWIDEMNVVSLIVSLFARVLGLKSSATLEKEKIVEVQTRLVEVKDVVATTLPAPPQSTDQPQPPA